MKKWTEKMMNLIAAFILMCAMIGCGQGTVDQGEVDTTPNENDPTLPGAGAGEGGDVLENKGKGGAGGDNKPDNPNPAGGGNPPPSP
jgi:hypothetical protein